MALIIPAQYADICLAWRDDRSGPMRVVSGPVGRERVHYEAPAASRLDAEMAAFLEWFNEEAAIDPVLKAALAKSSPDKALRDITDLVRRGILVRDAGGGRSTSYSLANVGDDASERIPE